MALSASTKRAVAVFVLALWLMLTALSAAAAQETEPADTAPGAADNLPGGIVLLVPLGIGAAAYVSYKLGPGNVDARAARREGAISRALDRMEES